MQSLQTPPLLNKSIAVPVCLSVCSSSSERNNTSAADSLAIVNPIGAPRSDSHRPLLESDLVDRQIEWQQANSGFDLYEPNSGATQLNISVSYFNYSVKHDPSAPVRIGRGMIACNTPALQQWWDAKNHHRVTDKR